ncbi:hypothetical protein [Stackebrandtia nassauensis]|uniref:Uncharacterized protein n=1 Tax=Stackebrandtia nassauensis (strain DSM 44728 / CIP 108903 / NRRL B-16338 / NBRC 102104 / LLR-40K-21) TaxID=446470 RepID=D3Q3S1_STANL|nr:hypothetical protein [Stackebrandtia nassauensis]ADD43988.1 hypothetical protein Snas_4341 [Stackebrandtia nassauensis DSM 44728]
MTRILRTTSLILGPLSLAASTFFWEDGRYGVTGGVLVALASTAWIYGLLGVWEHLRDRSPLLSAVGIVLTVVGTFGGIAFGTQGFFEGIFDVSGAESLDAAARYPVASWFVLWLPGPLFPISLMLLGAMLLRLRVTPVPVAVALMLGGLAFPASRVSRVDLIAHGADVVLLAASAALALLVARGLLDRPLKH